MSWSDCFDSSSFVEVNSDKFRLFSSLCADCESQGSTRRAAVLCLHGAGHTGLSWALLARELRGTCDVYSYDARGHGRTCTSDDGDLSLDRLVKDLSAIASKIGEMHGEQRLILIGHSMGGAVVCRAAQQNAVPSLAGMIVIDALEQMVVEGMEWAREESAQRPESFASEAEAVAWAVSSRMVLTKKSALISVPPMLHFDGTALRFIMDLNASVGFWEEWFRGASKAFVQAKIPRMLVVADVRKIDSDPQLMIAQMQVQRPAFPRCNGFPLCFFPLVSYQSKRFTNEYKQRTNSPLNLLSAAYAHGSHVRTVLS